MSEQLTDWFPGKVKPVRPGVYERVVSSGARHYSYWDGGKWMAFKSTVEDARRSIVESIFQSCKWRGLTSVSCCCENDSQTDDHTGICEVTE